MQTWHAFQLDKLAQESRDQLINFKMFAHDLVKTIKGNAIERKSFAKTFSENLITQPFQKKSGEATW